MPLPKGRTNNPKGRPRKNNTLTELLAKYGASKIESGEFAGMKARDAIVKMMWQRALYKEDLAAARYIFDRVDGKPVETLRAQIDSGDIPMIKTLQKDLFNIEELENDAGTLEPPEEAGAGAGE